MATLGLALGLTLGASGCLTTPVTGRKAFNLFSAEQDVQLGREAYTQIKAESRLVTSGDDFRMVNRIMDRLVAVADDPGYEWEVILIDDPSIVNAFALPGGKMAVYTGILPVCQDEAGLAVVMGHEIGHVVARHGTERMTRAYGLDLVTSLFDQQSYGQLADLALQVTLQMPHGRSQESESDHIGLMYMARAGYDPRKAPAFWERMAALSGGGPPEFLSTHPSSDTRVRQLRELLPAALEAYESAVSQL